MAVESGTLQQSAQAFHKEALSASVMQRYRVDIAVKRALGAKLETLMSASPAVVTMLAQTIVKVIEHGTPTWQVVAACAAVVGALLAAVVGTLVAIRSSNTSVQKCAQHRRPRPVAIQT